MSAPIVCHWDGEEFRPINPFMQRLADRDYVIGETYRLVHEAERSKKSHDHFFAQVDDEYQSLPEWIELFPSVDHFRAYCLIRAGYCDTSTIVASSKKEAARIAAFIKPMDTLAVVTVDECVVTRSVAHSQTYKAMPGGVFQKSKDAVFNQIAILRAKMHRAA